MWASCGSSNRPNTNCAGCSPRLRPTASPSSGTGCRTQQQLRRRERAAGDHDRVGVARCGARRRASAYSTPVASSPSPGPRSRSAAPSESARSSSCPPARPGGCRCSASTCRSSWGSPAGTSRTACSSRRCRTRRARAVRRPPRSPRWAVWTQPASPVGCARARPGSARPGRSRVEVAAPRWLAARPTGGVPLVELALGRAQRHLGVDRGAAADAAPADQRHGAEPRVARRRTRTGAATRSRGRPGPPSARSLRRCGARRPRAAARCGPAPASSPATTPPPAPEPTTTTSKRSLTPAIPRNDQSLAIRIASGEWKSISSYAPGPGAPGATKSL